MVVSSCLFISYTVKSRKNYFNELVVRLSVKLVASLGVFDFRPDKFVWKSCLEFELTSHHEVRSWHVHHLTLGIPVKNSNQDRVDNLALLNHLPANKFGEGLPDTVAFLKIGLH